MREDVFRIVSSMRKAKVVLKYWEDQVDTNPKAQQVIDRMRTRITELKQATAEALLDQAIKGADATALAIAGADLAMLGESAAADTGAA